jgi:hypothetical protein
MPPSSAHFRAATKLSGYVHTFKKAVLHHCTTKLLNDDDDFIYEYHIMTFLTTSGTYPEESPQNALHPVAHHRELCDHVATCSVHAVILESWSKSNVYQHCTSQTHAIHNRRFENHSLTRLLSTSYVYFFSNNNNNSNPRFSLPCTHILYILHF